MATAAVGQSSLREVRSVDRPQRRMDGQRVRVLLLGQVPDDVRAEREEKVMLIALLLLGATFEVRTVADIAA